MLSAQAIHAWLQKINSKSLLFKAFKTATILAVAGVLAFSFKQIGKTERDHDLLHDVHLLGQYIPEWSTIGIDRSMHNNYNMHCYIVRYYNITLDVNAESPHFILLEKAMDPPCEKGYEQKEIPLVLYSLYEFDEDFE